MIDERAALLLKVLRETAPVKVRVYDAQDEYRDIAVPTRRKKWSHVVATIEARPWARCECLDRSGCVIAGGDIRNEGPAGELEDIGSEPAQGGNGAFAAQSRWMLEMMIKAQTTALTFRDKEHTALLASMTTMLELNMQNTREMMQIMRLQRDEGMELAQIRAAAAQGDDLDQVLKLLEASPKIMGTLAPVLMALKGKKSSPPPQSKDPKKEA